MTKTQLMIVMVGAGAGLLVGTGRDAHAAPPKTPMSIQPTGPRPVDTAAPATVTPKPKDGEMAPNSIYAEGLGPGVFYSLNYERIVTEGLGVRGGFSYLSMSLSAGAGGNTATASSSFMTFPITASYLGLRSGKHGLELGGGATILYASGSGSTGLTSAEGSGMGLLGTAIVGYRIHPIDHAGFNFRVGGMAMVGNGIGFKPEPGKIGVLPSIYLSMGASF